METGPCMFHTFWSSGSRNKPVGALCLFCLFQPESIAGCERGTHIGLLRLVPGEHLRHLFLDAWHRAALRDSVCRVGVRERLG